MKYLGSILSVVLLALCSCTSDDLSEDALEQGIKSFTVDIPAPQLQANEFDFSYQSRTYGQFVEKQLLMYWSGDEKIEVYPYNGRSLDFQMAEGWTPRKASFESEAWALKDDYSYFAFYPFFERHEYATPAKVANISYEGQEVNSVYGATSKFVDIADFDYQYAMETRASSGRVNFELKRVGSILLIQVPLPKANVEYTKAVLKSNNDPFIATAALLINNGTVTPLTTSNTLEISLNNIKVSNVNVKPVLSVMLCPQDFSGKTLNLILTDENGLETVYKVNGYNFKANECNKLSAYL